MRLIRLYILKSGVFSNTLIDFTDNDIPQNILCLSGVNGTGKTTIMDLISNMGCFLNPELSLRNIFFDRLKPNILTQTEFAQLDLLIDNKLLSLVLGDKKNIQRDNKYPQAFIIENEIKSLIGKFENTVVKSPEDRKKIIGKLDEIEKIYFGEGFSGRDVAQINLEIFSDLSELIKDNIYNRLYRK